MNVATKYRISGHVTPGKTGRYVILTQSLPLPGGSDLPNAGRIQAQ